jgi:uncharacterized membrane protein YjgN (DUF898 family)
MEATRYQVIYQGTILEGFDMATVCRNVARVFAISEEKAKKVLASRQLILKKDLDEPAARRQVVGLSKAGLKVVLGKHGAAPATAQPVPAPRPQPPPAAAQHPGGGAAPRPAQPTQAAGTATAAKARSASMTFEFAGSGSEYFRIWIVNVLLTLLTLGIYSAWAKVRRKQYFYGNTCLQEAGFEYLADPMKILKGRILILAVILVTGFLSSLHPLVQPVFTLIFVLLLPWFVVRALAFNARNSAFHSIRFGFRATYGQAFKVYVLWPALAALTLGILSPYAFFKQKKFVVENSRYGKTAFTFNAGVKDYYRIFMVTSLPVLALMLLGALLALFPDLALSLLAFGPLLALGLLPAYLWGFAYFSVGTGNLLYRATRLGAHRLDSGMKVGSYLWLILVNTIATALTLGLFHPWAKVRTAHYKAEHLALIPAGDLDAFIAGSRAEVGALGDAASDFFDIDLGL